MSKTPLLRTGGAMGPQGPEGPQGPIGPVGPPGDGGGTIVGEIRAYYGAAGGWPVGWHLCDGLNGTPNLTGRALLGSGPGYTRGSEGGATTSRVTTDLGGSHDHATGSVALTSAQLPAHAHQSAGSTGSGTISGSTAISINNTVSGDNAYSLKAASSAATVGLTSYTGGGQTHNHGTTNTAGSHTHTVTTSTIQPYFVIDYIMYTGVV